MNRRQLLTGTRILLIICSIGLIAVLFLPIWRIDLNAPQYPEGLSLLIHANGIRGNVDIINGLNHYIGMKTLHDKDFLEFTILPYCIGFFAILFIITAIANKKKWFNLSFILFATFGVLAMVDFWRWEYNYGHNLDPHAAIIVPGMEYQPPLIGYKQLLNFAAYSIPDMGGWIFIGPGILLLCGLLLQWKSLSKIKLSKPNSLLAVMGLLLLVSCNRTAQPINIGMDNCDYCKMTISDKRYGAELITKTGKALKFDDIVCMKNYIASQNENVKYNALIYVTDFCGDHKLIMLDNAILLESNTLNCPMNGHIAAFSSKDSLAVVTISYPGKQIALSLK